MKFRKTGEVLTELLFPHTCPVCGRALPFSLFETEQKAKGKDTEAWLRGERRRLICDSCLNALCYVEEPLCQCCGRPVFPSEKENKELCGDCASRIRLFERCFCLMLYEGAARKAMAGIKYHGKKEHLRSFACIAALRYRKTFEALSIEALVPVPIHKKRRKKRGYNQAEELCRALSSYLNIPTDTVLLKRVKNTKAQNGLDPGGRMLNLQNAFAAAENKKPYQTVLLVDDIYTTGATMEACTEALLQAGIEKVYGFCLCIAGENLVQ